MEVLITVVTPETSETLVARAGMSKIGSAANCELRINHHEIAPHAASVEVRGNSILFQNRNEFPVYLGHTEVLPGSWLEWEDQMIQLSRSISLSITEVRSSTRDVPELTGKAKDGVEPGAAQKKIVQIGIIAMCLFGSVFMLSTESQTVPETKQKFSELVLELNDKPHLTASERRLRRHLQEAWITDLRWRDNRPELVVDFYQLLLNLPEVEQAQEGSFEKRVREFARSRLEAIRIMR